MSTKAYIKSSAMMQIGNDQNLTVSRTEAQCSALECSFGTLAASSAPFLAATVDQFMARFWCFRESGPKRLPPSCLICPAPVRWVWHLWIHDQCLVPTVWILLSGKSMDPLKPFEWIWMVVQLATNTVQMVSPCVYKTNFEWFHNSLSVGGLKDDRGHI